MHSVGNNEQNKGTMKEQKASESSEVFCNGHYRKGRERGTQCPLLPLLSRACHACFSGMNYILKMNMDSTCDNT